MFYVSGFPPHKTDSKNKPGIRTLNKTETKTETKTKVNG